MKEFNANCVFGGGSCFPSYDSEVDFFSQSTAIILIISVAFGILFAIIVMCCYIKCCPWNGNCERGWKNY